MVLTVIIPVFNEEDNLKELLPMLTWADEVMIIDSFSTDNTLNIAESYNVKILQHEYNGPAFQKNWAIPQARNKWVLIFDADERPTDKMISEIREILKNPFYNAYWIKRKNFFMGKEVYYSGWQNDKVIRLFKRDLCRYKETKVHEEIETEGKVGMLKEPMLHYTFKNLEHFKDKVERYARWSAEDYDKKTGKITFYHLYLKPAFRFIKHYFIKFGFLDGKVGLKISRLMASGVQKRYKYLKEMRNHKD